ncbi:VCBS repeat-containing protein [Pirellulales bacterium]|nr:VCBS repeat-containing protein [Pirellulales bacterium]
MHFPLRMRGYLYHWLPLICLALFWSTAEATEHWEWVHDSFEDFSQGKLDAAGHNIYVSRDGSVRTIHRFDLDSDGHLDLVFNNTHDTATDQKATFAQINTEGELETRRFDIDGSQRVVAADLNADGYPDLVFCPAANGLQDPARRLVIAWGSQDGWQEAHTTRHLAAMNPRDLAVGDFDGDEYPDIAVLAELHQIEYVRQNTAWVVRLFPGGPNGLAGEGWHDLSVQSLSTIATLEPPADGQPAGDRRCELLALTGDYRLLAYRFTKPLTEEALAVTTREYSLDIELPSRMIVARQGEHPQVWVGSDKSVVGLTLDRAAGTARKAWQIDQGATHLASGDLDQDGHLDLVTCRNVETRQAKGGEQGGATGKGEIRVYWADELGVRDENPVRLAVDFARAAAVGDLNGDGRNDLAVAVYQSEKRYEGESALFVSHPGRSLTRLPRGVPTAGAVDVLIVESSPESSAAAGSRSPTAIFCNTLGGTVDEHVPLDVYWGSSTGFDRENYTQIPFQSGYEASLADLNTDGFVDLIALNSGHSGSGSSREGANILWGSAHGLGNESPTVLSEPDLGSSHVADFNRDGYLDVVLGSYESSQKTSRLVIYFGSEQGYDKSRRQEFPSGSRSLSIGTGDFNCDDRLDLAVIDFFLHQVRIFYATVGGFDLENPTVLPVPTAIGMEVADLNADGFLDLIVGSYYNPRTQLFDAGVSIFWGSGDGFSPYRSQWLEGMAVVAATVADFDADGFLDLFACNYHGPSARAPLPSYLYWGGPQGFSSERRTQIIGNSISDALAADFDNDGKIDLAITCHTQHGDHRTDSFVLYNDGKRFTNSPRRELLPTHGAHWMYDQDLGHICDRSLTQQYLSPVLAWDTPASVVYVNAAAQLPVGTSLKFSVQSAKDESQLAGSPWRLLVDDSARLEAENRVLRYRATFISPNGDLFPVLERVAVRVETRAETSSNP